MFLTILPSRRIPALDTSWLNTCVFLTKRPPISFSITVYSFTVMRTAKGGGKPAITEVTEPCALQSLALSVPITEPFDCERCAARLRASVCCAEGPRILWRTTRSVCATMFATEAEFLAIMSLALIVTIDKSAEI